MKTAFEIIGLSKQKSSFKIYKNAIVARTKNKRVAITNNDNVDGAFQIEITAFDPSFKTESDVFCASKFLRTGVMVGVISIHENTMKMMISIMIEALNKREQERNTNTTAP